MRILIAPDKFKGSLTALEVVETIGSALLQRSPEIQVDAAPLADGGEGTLEVLTASSGGHFVSVEVLDPLGRIISSLYGVSGDGHTAFIEMARASGLQLLAPDERDCMKTSTWGTGQLIKHALDQGIKHVVLGIGGSATNDAGMGMARMLGFEFKDSADNLLPGTGQDLIRINTIRSSPIEDAIRKTDFTVLCDVDNPLDGVNGAAHVFARQKGATEEDIIRLDEGLHHFASVAARQYGINLNFPGAGAAGGLGAGAKLFLNATFTRGIDYVMDQIKLEERIKKADLIITGEGKVDEQTLSGKVVAGVIGLARRHNIPVALICGTCALEERFIQTWGVNQVISLTDKDTDTDTAIAQARALLTEKVFRYLRI